MGNGHELPQLLASSHGNRRCGMLLLSTVLYQWAGTYRDKTPNTRLIQDSARELLAIDVRQRKGEKLTGEEGSAEPPKQVRFSVETWDCFWLDFW